MTQNEIMKQKLNRFLGLQNQGTMNGLSKEQRMEIIDLEKEIDEWNRKLSSWEHDDEMGFSF